MPKEFKQAQDTRVLTGTAIGRYMGALTPHLEDIHVPQCVKHCK